MRRLIVALCLALVCGSYAVNAQQRPREKWRFVVVPPEIALVAIANQPGCPLQFENVRMIAHADGGGGSPDFQLRNRGSKPIRSLAYRWWTTLHTGGGWGWAGKSPGEVVMPGQLVPMGGEDDPDEIVPLTDELRDKLHLRSPLEGLAVLMILKVTYADGTTYDARPMYRALRAYSAKLNAFEEDSDDDDEDMKSPED